MGNAIAKKYDLPKEHTATAGHVNNWKIWPGKSKDSSGNLVSIWAFDKTDVMKRKQNPITDKTILEQLFQIMKKDFNLIKDSKTCSQIIQCLEIVEDSKNAIVFSTERIICSLSDLLSNFEHIPGGFAEQTSFFDATPTISEIEISRGLYNVSQGLQYLHTVQRKLHMNINPESIVITASGQWKLCGFGMSLSFAQGEQQRIASPYFMQPTANNVLTLVQRLEPDLRYSSPESTDGGLNPAGTRYVSTVSDVFSLGVIIYETYRHNLSKHRNTSMMYDLKPSVAIVHVTCNDVNQHHSSLKVIQSLDFSFLPGALVQLVVSMMQLNPQMRVSATEISSHTYFSSGTQAVLNMIDTMSSRDVGTQSSQLISLQNDIATFSSRILIYTVLPTISKLCLQNNTLWVYALPLYALMAKIIPDDKFAHLAGPFIIQALSTTKDLSTDTLQAFLCNLSFLCRSFSHEFFQGSLASLLCQSLERPNLFLQNLSLEKLSEEYVYSTFSTSTLADKIVPQLCKEACKNPEPNIKTQALYVISLVTWKLDETYVANNILPSLKYIVDNERTPAVSMSVIGNFESISNSLGLSYVASSILPVLQGMLLDESLDRDQFEMIVNIVKRLLKKIFDHRTMQLQMPEISVAEVVGKNAEDPFAPAKALISQAKQRNIANNYGMVTGAYSLNHSSPYPSGSTSNSSNDIKRNSVGNIPPPAPSGPPPPPPPGHAPLEHPSLESNHLSSGNPLFTSSSPSTHSYNMADNNNRELPGIYNKRGSIGGLAMASGIIPSSAVGDNNSTTIAPYQSNFNSATSSGVLNFSAPIDLTSTLASKSSLNYSNSNDDKKSYSSSNSYASNNTLNDGALGDNKSSSSMFSWFSSSKSGKEHTTGTTNGGSGYSGGSGSSSYAPPVIPGLLAATNSYNSSSSHDVDDFLSSFGQQTNTSTVINGNNNSMSRYSDSNKASLDTSKHLNNTASLSSQTTPSLPLHTQSNGSNSLSIQQQIEQTQLEIARLSTNTQVLPLCNNNTDIASSISYNIPPTSSSSSIQKSTISIGGWSSTSANTPGSLGNSSIAQQLPPQQQQFYGSHNSMNTGYAPPIASSNNISSTYPTISSTTTTAYQPPVASIGNNNSNSLIPNYNTSSSSSSLSYQPVVNTSYINGATSLNNNQILTTGNNYYSSQQQSLNYNNYQTTTTNNIGYYNNTMPNTNIINQASSTSYIPPTSNMLPNNNNTTVNRTTTTSINKTAQDPFDFLN